ncbi:MAG TPA: ATP-binding protein [Solirubrobacteraceae bacterium]|nr:ATP-binding protein [Solirubrobacteraceae bacterium]
MDLYDWPTREQFVNRAQDLAQLEAWWEHPTRDAMALVGRRRVGKSWLFRRFADGKPAVVLVADRRLVSTQMARFAGALEAEFGVRPDIRSVGELVRLLYELGRERKVLAVIDEFPFLLPDGRAREEVLSEIQAVMEDHRDSSRTKLLLCGSLIGQMESLLHSTSPLHGRLRPLDVWPMTFAESKAMACAADRPEERITRFAVAGGMARYLGELGDGPLRELVCANVLNCRGPLFDDPRAVLEQEFRSPATYFSILEVLAAGPVSTERLGRELQLRSASLTFYLDTLREMRLLSSFAPVGAPEGSRAHRHRVIDGFIRFWFRFVFGNQDALQEGLSPLDLWVGDIEPHLAEYVAPTFEELCVRYTRRVYGAGAANVGAWWGPALHRHRQTGERLSEEIDVVGAQRRNLKVAGECKWTATPMPKRVLDDLRELKLPAVAQEGRLKVPAAGPAIVLFARSGFAPELLAAAEADEKVTLVDLDTLVSELDREAHGG